MVTRKDVAEKAGVSVTAVSRVINNSGYVQKEKREAILAAIREVGYRPKTIPILNPRPELRQILFLNRDPGNSYTIEMYRGMVEYAWSRKYMVALSGIWSPHEIQSMAVSGVVIGNEWETLEFDRTFGEVIPIPAVSASYGEFCIQPKHIPFVECDSYAGMENLLNYLLAKGHRKIAFASSFAVNENNPRGLAWYAKMRPLLMEKISEYIFVGENLIRIEGIEEVDFRRMGEQLAKRMIERKSDATAVACFNDDIALGMMLHFQRKGVKIPEDISVMSLGGMENGRYCYPSLTSIYLPAFEQGRKCMRILLDMIEGKKVPMRSRIKIGTLIEGDSVKELK